MAPRHKYQLTVTLRNGNSHTAMFPNQLECVDEYDRVLAELEQQASTFVAIIDQDAVTSIRIDDVVSVGYRRAANGTNAEQR